MSDLSPEHDEDLVTVLAKVQVENVQAKKASQKIEVRLTTSYNLEKMDGLNEAMMNCAGGVAEMTLKFRPETQDLFEGEEDEGQQELEEQ